MPASSQLISDNTFQSTAEDVIASDVCTSFDDMFIGLLNSEESLLQLEEDFLPSFISNHPSPRTNFSAVALPITTAPTSLCEHSACHFASWQEVYTSFARLDQTKCVRIVLAMLLATSAPKGEYNALNASSASAWRRETKRRQVNDKKEERSHIVYFALSRYTTTQKEA